MNKKHAINRTSFRRSILVYQCNLRLFDYYNSFCDVYLNNFLNSIQKYPNSHKKLIKYIN